MDIFINGKHCLDKDEAVTETMANQLPAQIENHPMGKNQCLTTLLCLHTGALHNYAMLIVILMGRWLAQL